MAIDITKTLLSTPLDQYEYMRMPIALIPEHFIEQYNLREKAVNGYIYMGIRMGIYGLPPAGILANKLLKERIGKHGYYEVQHTPGLFKYITKDI